MGLALIFTDLQAARAPAISSLLQVIGWRKEEGKNASPSLLMEYVQMDHTFVSISFWNLVTQLRLVTREAENAVICLVRCMASQFTQM